MRDIGENTVETTLKLEKGDVVALYTDGVTEARDDQGKLFGMDRLCAAIERLRDAPVEEIASPYRPCCK